MRRSITKKGHKLMSKDKTESQLDLGHQQIVIADRGWVWVGKTNFNGDDLVIEDARCIRYWGTTSGLGQLAEHEPTPTTKLDKAGRIVVSRRALIARIACKTSW